MNNDTFICQGCQGTGHINGLRKRLTMPGEYCAICADNEKCAACGEVYPLAFTSYKDDVQNVICEDCAHTYKIVKQYIKPIYSLALKKSA